MKVLRHRLVHNNGTPYPYQESPNRGGGLKPQYLVIHYTAGSTASGAISSLCNPARQASAHLVIGRDGSITQLVPFNRVAWHAGKSSWNGLVGLNQYSIGIELDNAGKLQAHGDAWLAWFGKSYSAAEVLVATHKNEHRPAGWHIYSPAQIAAANEVGLLLMNHYGLRDVLGHDDIAPTRKVDPGPAFPMSSYRAYLLGRRLDEEDVYKTTTHLNIRSGPGPNFDKLPGSPLPPETQVDILNAEGSWRFVDVLTPLPGVEDLQGWVHGRYLTLII